MRSPIGVPALLLALLCGCSSAAFDAQAPSPLVLASARVADIGEPGFGSAPAQLEDGRWEGNPFVAGAAERPRLLLLDSPQVAADLDGDGAAERVALLAASSGGSGERVYIAVFGSRAGKAVQRGIARVGDRVKPRAFSVEGGEVVLDVVEPGRDEPACCGTQLARYRYRLTNVSLQPQSHEVQGVLSLDAFNGEWLLVEQDGAPLPAGARAPTLTIAGSAVSGFGGCNRYRGELKEAAAGAFVPGPHLLMSTKMACEEPQSGIEDRFLAALTLAKRYGVLAGRLLIDWEDGERRGTLLLSR